MPSGAADIIYVGRSRLHRMRANTIQTLHTAAAFVQSGRRVELWLPPWRRRLKVKDVLHHAGVAVDVDVRRSQLLHPRWGVLPFVRLQRRRLAAAPLLYCRDARIGLSLIAEGLEAHMEVHDVGKIRSEGLLDQVVDAHRAGRFGVLIPISRAAATALVDAGADPGRLHVAPSGVDVAAYASVPPFDPGRLDDPRIVCVGHIDEAHGVHIFEALARRPGLSVTLVGGRTSTPPAPGVEIVPFVPPREVPDWYGRCDIALMPYQRSVGHIDSISPIKVFEAMAAGRPIIASDLPALRELIDDGRTGLLVAADDVEAWLAAIGRLRSDRGLAKRLAESARREAPKYSWRARADGILRAIDAAG